MATRVNYAKKRFLKLAAPNRIPGLLSYKEAYLLLIEGSITVEEGLEGVYTEANGFEALTWVFGDDGVIIQGWVSHILRPTAIAITEECGGVGNLYMHFNPAYMPIMKTGVCFEVAAAATNTFANRVVGTQQNIVFPHLMVPVEEGDQLFVHLAYADYHAVDGNDDGHEQDFNMGLMWVEKP